MFVFILALLIVWPIAEIYLMVVVSQAIGFFWMLTLIFLSAVGGMLVLRHRGRVHWQRLRGAVSDRRPPAREAFDGVMITTGAALLIIPGFITSAIGLLLLFPPTRFLLRITLFFFFASRFKVATTTATWTASQYGGYRDRTAGIRRRRRGGRRHRPPGRHAAAASADRGEGDREIRGPGDDAVKTHSIEIVDPESELFVSLTAGGSGAIMLGQHVLAAAPIPETGLDGLDDGPLELETERGSLSVVIESRGEPILLEGDLAGKREARLVSITGELLEGERRIDLDCPGVLHARDGASPGPSLTRDLTIVLSDGGLICVAALRGSDADAHGDEEAIAAISHPGGYIEFEQALLSTEYDDAGRQRRATLELWPESDEIAALHGAGSVISGCTAKVGNATINTALFRWSLDGHSGLGRYEISSAGRKVEG